MAGGTIGGNASSSKSFVIPFSENELLLQGINIDFAREQLSNLISAGGIQQFIQQRFKSAFEGIDANLQASGELSGLAQGSLKQLLEGGSVSDAQTALLDDILGSQIEGIRSSTQQNLELVKQELAPALGLRGGDSPIIDRGGRIAEAGIRAESAAQAQRSQNELGLRGQEAQFLSSLADQDFLKRLNLGGQASQSSIALSGVGGGNVAAQQQSLRPNVGNKQESFGFKV